MRFAAAQQVFRFRPFERAQERQAALYQEQTRVEGLEAAMAYGLFLDDSTSKSIGADNERLVRFTAENNLDELLEVALAIEVIVSVEAPQIDGEVQ